MLVIRMGLALETPRFLSLFLDNAKLTPLGTH
jgi:hypothetical protein